MQLGVSHLDRSGSLGLSPAEVDLSSDGQTDKEPVAEAVVVDELEDVFYSQVDKRHQTLRTGARTTEVLLASYRYVCCHSIVFI